ncbi:UNVERIFIED_CONTAM: hypothetical protein FKN15_005734 [Acipenser sinensis]
MAVRTAATKSNKQEKSPHPVEENLHYIVQYLSASKRHPVILNGQTLAPTTNKFSARLKNKTSSLDLNSVKLPGTPIKQSYCLKVKEMDDEEYSCIALGEPLYRVATGNYEYRLVLRCRQEARARFAKMRKDVLEKIELLDQKHVQDIVFQLQRFVSGMSRYYDECYAVLKDADVFPIEVDLSRTMLNYGRQRELYAEDEDEGDEEQPEEGQGELGDGDARQEENGEKLIDDD